MIGYFWSACALLILALALSTNTDPRMAPEWAIKVIFLLAGIVAGIGFGKLLTGG